MRDRLKAYMERLGISVSEMSRRLGITRPYLSRYLNGEDIDTVEEAARAYFEREQAKADGRWHFVSTKSARIIWGICENAAHDGEIGVIIGPAGGGKTMALAEYARAHPGETIYLKADVSMKSRDLLQELGEKIGIVLQGTIRQMLRHLERVLADDPRLIIVDEADTLTVRQMEILRALHDSTGCGLVLAGLPRLKLHLTRGPSARENLAQLYSRVGWMWECPYPDPEDVRAVLAGHNISIDEAALKELMGVAASNGLRGVQRTVRRALKVAFALGEEVLNAKHIREARRFIITG